MEQFNCCCGRRPLKPLILACSIFRAECECLRDTLPDCDWRFLDSMYHMQPAALRKAMNREVASLGDRPVVLLYGDCHAYMHDLTVARRVTRPAGINCCEILLGSDRYRALRRDGAFMLMPEWARRWREVFAHQLGLDETVARQLMQEHHRFLLYLDTGLAPVPEADLADFAAYCGLPWRVEAVGLEHLAAAIGAARAEAQDA